MLGRHWTLMKSELQYDVQNCISLFKETLCFHQRVSQSLSQNKHVPYIYDALSHNIIKVRGNNFAAS